MRKSKSSAIPDITVDEATARAAIFDVIDRHRFRLYEGAVVNTTTGAPDNGITEEFATEERMKLADAVIARWRELDDLRREALFHVPKTVSRAQIASAVYDCAHEAFESFREGNIGADLAYLMGVILSKPELQLVVDWSRSGCAPELLTALREKFPPESPLWNYIVLGDREPAEPKLTTIEEMDAALANLKAEGLIQEVAD
jgi:hypothetical protein